MLLLQLVSFNRQLWWELFDPIENSCNSLIRWSPSCCPICIRCSIPSSIRCPSSSLQLIRCPIPISCQLPNLALSLANHSTPSSTVWFHLMAAIYDYHDFECLIKERNVERTPWLSSQSVTTAQSNNHLFMWLTTQMSRNLSLTFLSTLFESVCAVAMITTHIYFSIFLFFHFLQPKKIDFTAINLFFPSSLYSMWILSRQNIKKFVINSSDKLFVNKKIQIVNEKKKSIKML